MSRWRTAQQGVAAATPLGEAKSLSQPDRDVDQHLHKGTSMFAAISVLILLIALPAKVTLAANFEEPIRYGIDECQGDFRQFLNSGLSREAYNAFCGCYIRKTFEGLTEQERQYQERFRRPSPEFSEYAMSVRNKCLLPGFTNEDLPHQDRVAAFVSAFIERDFQARTLLNPSNRALFAEGYRPKIGVPRDPEAGGHSFSDIQAYFTRKLYLDLNSVSPLNQSTFQSFVDQIGRWANQTIICVGEISRKYDLTAKGPYNFKTEFAKVPAGPEREEFKLCWLNDFILGTEVRMLAWIYEQLFNAPYVNPHKR